MAWISGCKVNNPNKVFSFRKDFTIDKKRQSAVLQCTAPGIYFASLSGVKVGKHFLTPGFTSYRRHLQEQNFDIMYRRVLGREALTPGYQKSQIRPIVGGGLTHAEGHTITPYGRLSVHWEVKDNIFSLDLKVPDGTESQIILPSGEVKKVSSGEYHFSEERK